MTDRERTRTTPVQVNDFAAAGLNTGECVLGQVVARDDTWVTLALLEGPVHQAGGHVRAVRWSEIVRLELAYPENAESFGEGLLLNDTHLVEMQEAWQRTHDWSEHPYAKVVRQVRREMNSRPT